MHSLSSTTDLHGIDRVALDRVIDPIVRAHGAEVVGVEFKPERAGWVLRVSVERAGASERLMSVRDAAVNLELCANISRDLSPALDVADLIHHRYQLEVSTPGVERELRGERDFVRFAGQAAKFMFSPPFDGRHVTDGILRGVVDGKVRIEHIGSDGWIDEVPIETIKKSRLLFEFGRALESERRTGKPKH